VGIACRIEAVELQQVEGLRQRTRKVFRDNDARRPLLVFRSANLRLRGGGW